MVFIVDSAKKKAVKAQDEEIATRRELEPLRKYSKIRNVESAQKKIINKSIEIQKEIAERTRKIKEYRGRLEVAVEAMKNAVEGYGDEYILPVDSILDELAEDFSHKNAGVKLKEARAATKTIIKNDTAAWCSTLDAPHQVIVLALDAFNSKVDDVLSKVKSDNYGKLKQKIKDAFTIVNHLGENVWKVAITDEYLDARLLELRWATRARALQLKEREEQKAIRDAMREEERAIREAEKARKEAETEEKMLQKAMEIAKQKFEEKFEAASEEERQKYEQERRELEEQLLEAQEKNKRAISLAQQTKMGNIYVISNIGSFGEGVYKIGLTRRYDPMVRVKELGDASVPFPFDVHAMISSNDAPALENEMHHAFSDKRVNLVNTRKEFFRVDLSEIRKVLEDKSCENVTWTMRAEAAEYRESKAKANLGSMNSNEEHEADLLDVQDYSL